MIHWFNNNQIWNVPTGNIDIILHINIMRFFFHANRLVQKDERKDRPILRVTTVMIERALRREGQKTDLKSMSRVVVALCRAKGRKAGVLSEDNVRRWVRSPRRKCDERSNLKWNLFVISFPLIDNFALHCRVITSCGNFAVVGTAAAWSWKLTSRATPFLRLSLKEWKEKKIKKKRTKRKKTGVG